MHVGFGSWFDQSVECCSAAAGMFGKINFIIDGRVFICTELSNAIDLIDRTVARRIISVVIK